MRRFSTCNPLISFCIFRITPIESIKMSDAVAICSVSRSTLLNQVAGYEGQQSNLKNEHPESSTIRLNPLLILFWLLWFITAKRRSLICAADQGASVKK